MQAIIPFIGLRYLRPQKGEAFTFIVALFSFFGMILGVATLIVVMSVMNGFRDELFSKILGVNGHLAITDIKAERTYDPLVDIIEKHPYIEYATPLIYGQVLATTDSYSTGALVRSMSPESFLKRKIFRESLISGDLNNFYGKDKVILGAGLARKLGVTVGQRIQLVAPEGSVSPFGLIPRNKSYYIVGLSEVGMSQYDTTTIYMPLEAAQLFFKMPHRVSEIDIVLNDSTKLDETKRDLKQLLFDNRQPYAYIIDWRQKHAGFYHVLLVEQSVMFIILFLIVLVASFNIISSMIMLVRSKFKDIAILRTMGASKRKILFIFLFSGSFIGVVGILFGTAAGLLICSNISTIFETLQHWTHSLTGIQLFDQQFYYLSTLPAVVKTEEVIQIVCIAFCLTLVSAFLPAWRAAKLDPVKALRNE